MSTAHKLVVDWLRNNAKIDQKEIGKPIQSYEESSKSKGG
jgi:hypothetical protein